MCMHFLIFLSRNNLSFKSSFRTSQNLFFKVFSLSYQTLFCLIFNKYSIILCFCFYIILKVYVSTSLVETHNLQTNLYQVGQM